MHMTKQKEMKTQIIARSANTKASGANTEKKEKSPKFHSVLQLQRNII